MFICSPTKCTIMWIWYGVWHALINFTSWWLATPKFLETYETLLIFFCPLEKILETLAQISCDCDNTKSQHLKPLKIIYGIMQFVFWKICSFFVERFIIYKQNFIPFCHLGRWYSFILFQTEVTLNFFD